MASEDCAAIVFPRGASALVSLEDVPVVGCHRWYMHMSRNRPYIYALITRDSREALHRFLMRPPEGMVVDHKNRNPFDNRRCNLRLATVRQNSCNMVRRPGAYKGVNWSTAAGKWAATISDGTRKLALGVFVDPIDAARAYDRAALSIHGEFAAINFPEPNAQPEPNVVLTISSLGRDKRARLRKEQAE